MLVTTPTLASVVLYLTDVVSGAKGPHLIPTINLTASDRSLNVGDNTNIGERGFFQFRFLEAFFNRESPFERCCVWPRSPKKRYSGFTNCKQRPFSL